MSRTNAMKKQERKRLQNQMKGLDTRIGFGKRNTELIIAALNRTEETAAQLCKDYTLNGYNDWFLPTKDELNLLYVNLKKFNFFNFGGFSKKCYWSSSQFDNDCIFAWAQNFSDGSQYNFNKSSIFFVRAVRAF